MGVICRCLSWGSKQTKGNTFILLACKISAIGHLARSIYAYTYFLLGMPALRLVLGILWHYSSSLDCRGQFPWRKWTFGRVEPMALYPILFLLYIFYWTFTPPSLQAGSISNISHPGSCSPTFPFLSSAHEGPGNPWSPRS